MLKKITGFITAHKIASGVIIVVLIVIGYFLFKGTTPTETRYVTTTVQKGNIVASLSGSGQVAASNTIDLKARGTGTITYVGVKPGDTVYRGKTLFSLDARSAQKAVRDAETNLETAQLDLEKLKEPPTTLEVLQIKAAIADAETSKKDAAQAVTDAYRDLLNTSTVATATSSSAVTAPTVTGSYQKDTEGQIHISVYQTGGGVYFSASGLTTETGLVDTNVAQPIGDSGLYIKFSSTGNQPDWIINLPNKSATSYQTDYDAYQKAIKDQVTKNASADLTIEQNNEKLLELSTPNALDVRAKEIAVTQKEDALADAKANLSDYYVFAPFDGIIASVVAKVGDTASATLGTIITKQKIATISLNEVDVSKIKLGQKATLSFDAIDGLSITGAVAEIDTVGTVTQGVVTYSVKLSFDTDDSRVKPGMSVSAAIITDIKQDVLVVPSSAIKSNANGSYVEMFDTPLTDPQATTTAGALSTIAPKQITVTVGISDDTSSEIISGIKEGDQIVSRTITTATTKKATTTAPSLFGSAGARVGGNTGGARATTTR